MKNLKFSLSLVKKYPELEDASYIVNVPGSNSLDLSETQEYIFVIKHGYIYRLSICSGKCDMVFDISSIIPQNESHKAIRVVGATYDLILNILLLCLESGELMTISVNSVGCSDCLAVQKYGYGFELMEFSPDLEYGVCVTKTNSVTIITTEFNVMREIDLLRDEQEEEKFISVGWGKKETQFHGSEGKSAALAPPPTVSDGLVNDEHRTCVSWRGDGMLFAIGYWCVRSRNRKIKIFTKEGMLQRIGENLPGLEDPMSWRPTGNIALTQALPNKYIIAFMEKNGLKHNEFLLPSNIKVKNMFWNASSSILGMICKEKESGTESVLLWSTGNYHWYLKQKFSLPSPITFLVWDEMRANRLHGICKNGTYFEIEWVWTVDYSKGFKTTDPAYIAAIDNDKILLTSFKEVIVPPPMSQWSLQCPSSVNHVLFPAWESKSSDDDNNCLLAVMDNNQVAHFKRNSDDPQLENSYQIDWPQGNPFALPLGLNHWLWMKPNIVIVCGTTEGKKTVICYLEMIGGQLVARESTSLDETFITCSGDNEEVIMQTSAGNLFVYHIDSRTVTPHKIKLPEPCLELVYNSHGIFSLSERNRMFVNDVQVANNVTSFLVHELYLLATTNTHHLLIIKLNEITEKLVLRKLERGSKLVVASGNSVIFQLPRGNLETIQPRALTIHNAGKLLDKLMYKEVMTLLRRQRIDLNICVDHNPRQFLDNIENFVKEVDAQWITLLVTELSDCDVTKGAYATYYDEDSKMETLPDKVKQVCSALYTAMTNSQSKGELTLPILSCLVKVNEMKKAIDLANTEQALKYLLFLVDVDRLYIEALAAYNLEAALRIAGKSQKDPKEYIPYLNSLRSMNPMYMKYTIDKSLRKYSSALEHIAQCSEENMIEECFSLIKEHALFEKALKIFRNSEYRYKRTAALYADYLYNLRSYNEAGIMYTRCGDNEKAIHSFLKVGNWRKCMILAKDSSYSEEKQKELAKTLCKILRSTKHYVDAALFCINYLHDIDQGVEFYILAKLWQEAIYLTNFYDTTVFKDENIKSSLIENVESLLEDLKQRKEKINNYTNRLTIVREMKLTKKTNGGFDEMIDNQSDTSSITSMKSSMSRTSKNTRKTQRKMWSLKEGNPREEQALVATLSEMIQSSEKLTGEVHTTCEALLHFREDEEACSLQSSMKNLLELIEKFRPTIWPKETDETPDFVDQQLKIPPASCVHPSWELEILKRNQTS